MRARFLTQLCVTEIGHKTWRLASPLIYDSPILCARVVVPVRFPTDFASVPRWLPIAFALAGDTAHEAAVVHDFLYQTHKVDGRMLYREDADRVFREAMLVSAVPAWRAQIMFLGVRFGGTNPWNSGPRRLAQKRLKFNLTNE